MPVTRVDKSMLEHLYETFNRRRYVHPDPLEFLYGYPAVRDREIVALVAASLAYGRVAQILKSVGAVLDRMQPAPYPFLQTATLLDLRQTFDGFVHRFARGEHLASLLFGAAMAIRRFGSLQACYLAAPASARASTVDTLAFFVRQLTDGAGDGPGHLLPRPERGSACKRLHLFLRWMVRKDAVDPGGWPKVPASSLIVPLDTHMHRLGLQLGLTSRRQADMRTALEITESFRRVSPDDPVRYDFALTRLGIRNDVEFPLIARD